MHHGPRYDFFATIQVHISQNQSEAANQHHVTYVDVITLIYFKPRVRSKLWEPCKKLLQTLGPWGHFKQEVVKFIVPLTSKGLNSFIGCNRVWHFSLAWIHTTIRPSATCLNSFNWLRVSFHFVEPIGLLIGKFVWQSLQFSLTSNDK